MTSRYGDLDRPPLAVAPLRRALVTPRSLWSDVEVVGETPSTNAFLVARAADPDVDGVVVLAEYQTAGRGRLDRSWSAPARSGVILSVLVRPSVLDVARWPWLSLLSGLAVAAAVRNEGGLDARLKWPNDVVIEDRKLAGVLVERVEVAGRPAAAVIGIGVNVSLRRAELPVESATSLALEGAATTDRSLLARAVLRALDGLLQQWEGAGGDAGKGLRAAYTAACSTLGRDVWVELPGGACVDGTAVDVDDSGRLVVETPRGRQAFGAGDVVHLRPRA